MGPYRTLRGPEVSVEQTLVADSPRPTFIKNKPEGAICCWAVWLILHHRQTRIEIKSGNYGKRNVSELPGAGIMENVLFLSRQARE
jgi:hypothetical protein